MQCADSVLVLGDHGMVGRAITRELTRLGFSNVFGSKPWDLRKQTDCRDLFKRVTPKYVFQCAGVVGGILANSRRPADFIQDNLEICTNVIRCAAEAPSCKLLNLGSSCIYPRDCKQPIQESSLLSGALEETNRAYAIAKIAAIELCDSYRRQYGCSFISAMPSNLYGIHDQFDLAAAHVIPAMIRRFLEADEEVVLGGNGTARREFLYVDDLAQACVFLMERFDEPGPINVGTGSDVTIAELAALITTETGFQGEVCWDASIPNGTPQKLLDVRRMTNLGWTSVTTLQEGLRRTIEWVQSGAPMRGWNRLR